MDAVAEVENGAETGVRASVKQPVVVVAKAPAKELVRILGRVAGIVERRNTMQILSSVLVSKRGARVELTTSDLDIQMITHAELGGSAQVMETAVGAKKLLDILKALPDEQVVTLTLDQNRLMVAGGKSRFKLQTLPADEFPLVVRAQDYGASLQVPQKTLLKLIDQVWYAMGVRDIRYFLNGMCLEACGNELHAVATDGNRLARACANVENNLGEAKVILPRKTVLELQRMLKADDSVVTIKLASSQASFEFNDIQITTKLMEGRFPDYRRATPDAAQTKPVVFERAMLLQALQRNQLLSSQKYRGVELRFTSGTLRLTVDNTEGESGTEELGIDYEGDELIIGINVMFAIEALTNMDCDTVTVGLRGGSEAILLTRQDEPMFRGVIMPLRM